MAAESSSTTAEGSMPRQVITLLDHTQLHKTVCTFILVGNGFQLIAVNTIRIFNVTQPLVEQPEAVVAHRRAYTTSSRSDRKQ